MDTNYLKYGKKYPFLVKNEQLESIAPISCRVEKSNIANPLNPQDAFGLAHNLAVINFFQLVGFENNSSKSQMKQQAFDFFGVPSQFQNLLANASINSTKNPSDYDSEMMKWYRTNPIIYDRYAELRSIVENNSSLAHKIDSIKKVEYAWISRNDSTSVMKTMLTASSIARYSLSLWYEANVHGNIPDTPVLYPARVDWWGVARTDIYGACIGGFSTANPFVALGWGGSFLRS